MKVKIWKKAKYFLPLLSLGIILFTKPLLETIFSLKEPQIFYLNQRRALYPNRTVARFFENKGTLTGYLFTRNFFEGLDLNLYFFASHPRERAGVTEKEKFSWLLLPFFLIGVYYQIKKRIFWPISYFLLTLIFISLFLRIDYFLFLLFPFFVLSIIFGVYFLLSKSAKYI